MKKRPNYCFFESNGRNTPSPAIRVEAEQMFDGFTLVAQYLQPEPALSWYGPHELRLAAQRPIGAG